MTGAVRITQPLSGDSAARGRNGWFVPRAIAVDRNYEGELTLEVTSNRTYENVAPIHLRLTDEDAAHLVKSLTTALGWPVPAHKEVSAT